MRIRKRTGEVECFMLKIIDNNHKLLPIRREIESYNPQLHKTAEHLKAVYQGAQNCDMPMTILELLDEKYLEKNELRYTSFTGYTSTLKKFKKR